MGQLNTYNPLSCNDIKIMHATDMMACIGNLSLSLSQCPRPCPFETVPLPRSVCPCCKLYIDIDIEIVIDILKMSYDDMLWQPVPAPVSCPCLCPCAVSHMMTCFGNQSLLVSCSCLCPCAVSHMMTCFGNLPLHLCPALCLYLSVYVPVSLCCIPVRVSLSLPCYPCTHPHKKIKKT